MSLSASVWLVIVLALVAANAPFLNRRFLAIGPQRRSDRLLWRWLELLLAYFLVGGVAMLLEQQSGQITRQGWEFYAITMALFLTLAFPGFVYRYLLRK